MNVRPLQKRFERMQCKALPCIALLAILEKLEQTPWLSYRRQRLLQNQCYEAGQRLHTCDIQQQTALRIKPEPQEKEAVFYEALAAGLQ